MLILKDYSLSLEKGSAEFLEAVIESSYNGIIVIDEHGRIVLFNKSAERILKTPAEEAFGRFISDLIPESDMFSVLHSNKPQPAVKIKVGDQLLYSNRSPLIVNGETVGAISVFQEIYGIKELTRKLDEAETAVETLETIVENIIDGILLVDRKGYITRINKAYQEFLGVKAEDVIGKHVTEVIENTRMHIVAETGEEEIGHPQKIKGREMIVMRIPIFKDGESVGAVGKVMFRDISELRTLASKLNVMEDKLTFYKKELQRIQGARYSFSNIIGDSELITNAINLSKQGAMGNSTILISGESGTGKELFAQAIHNYSFRRFGPFIRVNCAAIPASLFESELFGYESGAFTGASKEGKPGKFELANGGTIFLDEIAELPVEMQVKMLRVLQEKEVERIGGNKVIPLDIRVIAATNKPIEKLIDNEKFRKDLYYRLNIIRVELPSLREIKEDIPLLARQLLKNLNEELGTMVTDIDDEVFQVFLAHTWPGNIRELRNVLERSVNICRDGNVSKFHLPFYLLENEVKIYKDIMLDNSEGVVPLKELLENVEKDAILKTLEFTGNNRREAAKLLGIHRSALYQKMGKYNLP